MISYDGVSLVGMLEEKDLSLAADPSDVERPTQIFCKSFPEVIIRIPAEVRKSDGIFCLCGCLFWGGV